MISQVCPLASFLLHVALFLVNDSQALFEKMSSRHIERIERLEETFWVVYRCKGNSQDNRGEETMKIYYKIPGKYLYKRDARKVFNELYEKDVKEACKGKYSNYEFIDIITDEEKNRLVKI